MAQYRPILVEHPIQPKTRDEVRALADRAIDEIIGKLISQRQDKAA